MSILIYINIGIDIIFSDKEISMSVLNELQSLIEIDNVVTAIDAVDKLPPKKKKQMTDNKLDGEEKKKIKIAIDKQKKQITPENIEQKIKKVEGGLDNVEGEIPLDLFADVKNGISMVKAWISGEYKAIPWETIVGITVGLLYLISPVDVIPDPIPVAGFIDDVAVNMFILKPLSNDIARYVEWEKENKK